MSDAVPFLRKQRALIGYNGDMHRQFGAVLFLFAFAAATLCAQGGFQGPGRYEITNVDSGKVIDLDRNDQTTVIQYSSRGTDNQTWEVRPAGSGFYYLVNAMNGYALDAGPARNSTPLRGMPLNSSPSQQWRFEPGKDGRVLIVSRLGKTIDVPDGTDRDGVRLQVYEPNGDANQRFSLRWVGGAGFRGAPGRGEQRRAGIERGQGDLLTCESSSGGRVFCEADARNGAQLVRQLGDVPCRLNASWGFDQRGIWVDRGCRGVFAVGSRDVSAGSMPEQRITCSSINGGRVFCEADMRGGRIDMVRQISGSPCREGQTWGYDRRGIWVDRGCRAEFAIHR
jgi:hypothetical protein